MGPCESRMLPSQVVRLLGRTVHNYQKHSSHKNTPLTFDLTWLRRRTSLEGSNFQFQKLHYHLWIRSAARISKKSRMLFRKTIKVKTMKHPYILTTVNMNTNACNTRKHWSLIQNKLKYIFWDMCEHIAKASADLWFIILTHLPCLIATQRCFFTLSFSLVAT